MLLNLMEVKDVEISNYFDLFLSPNKVIYESIMKGQALEFNGKKLNKGKVWDMLEKPALYHKLIKKIESLPALIKQLYFLKMSEEDLSSFLWLFYWNKNSRVVLSNKTKQRIKRDNEVYIYSEDSKSRFDFLKSVEAVLDSKFVAKAMRNSESAGYQ